MNNIILVVGRVLFSFLFIAGGIDHFTLFLTGGLTHFTKTPFHEEFLKYKKDPIVGLAVMISGLFLTLGGLLILLGFFVDLGALLLILFLLPAAILIHNYWSETDALVKSASEAQFWKNISLAGAAMILFGLVAKHHGIAGDNFGWVISKAHIALWK